MSLEQLQADIEVALEDYVVPQLREQAVQGLLDILLVEPETTLAALIEAIKEAAIEEALAAEQTDDESMPDAADENMFEEIDESEHEPGPELAPKSEVTEQTTENTAVLSFVASNVTPPIAEVSAVPPTAPAQVVAPVAVITDNNNDNTRTQVESPDRTDRDRARRAAARVKTALDRGEKGVRRTYATEIAVMSDVDYRSVVSGKPMRGIVPDLLQQLKELDTAKEAVVKIKTPIVRYADDIELGEPDA